MTEHETVKKYLVAHWGAVCRQVGTSNVDAIITKVMKGEAINPKTIEDGANLDLVELLTALAAAATLVSSSIEVYSLVGRSAYRSAEDEFVAECVKRNDKLTPEDILRIRRIYRELTSGESISQGSETSTK